MRLAAALVVLVNGVALAQAGLGTHQRATNDPLFIAQEMLGRPTDTTVTINAAAARDLDVYYEYGLKSGDYTAKTPITKSSTGRPFHVLIENLHPNTRYFYRMRYREPGASPFGVRPEHTFQTARPSGSRFTFVVQFDPHNDDNTDDETYKLSLKNMVADNPDFIIDDGDNFFTDKLQPVTMAGVEDRIQLMRSYYDILCHSTAMFLALGGHEGERGLPANGSVENLAVWDTVLRKQYIPNPEANGFYTGGGKKEPVVGYRQAYYAWNWGDALFVVLDPYWYKNNPPEQGGGPWNLTLGKEQYDWFRKTLETSKARYKFVFSHHLIGGAQLPKFGGSRGGMEVAKYYENGGYDLEGNYVFNKMRPGWGKPLHQVMADNKVTIYFHGHDHTYAKQDLDGIVYQAGPQPSARNIGLGTRADDYNYKQGVVLGYTGYLRVRVSPEDVKVDYVTTWTPKTETATNKNGMIAHSYTIKAQ